MIFCKIKMMIKASKMEQKTMTWNDYKEHVKNTDAEAYEDLIESELLAAIVRCSQLGLEFSIKPINR